MDKQETLKNILIAGAVFLLIMSVVPRLMPPPPDTGAGRTGTPPPRHIPQEAPSGTREAGAGALMVREAPEVATVDIGAAPTDGIDSDNPGPYRLHLLISNIGASVATATITDHAQELGKSDRYQLLNSIEHEGRLPRHSLAVEKINVDGVDYMLFDKRWHLEPKRSYERERADGTKEAGQAVSAWIELHGGGAPALRITRTFFLPRQTVKSRRHDVWTDLRIENRSDVPHTTLVTYLGGLGVPQGNTRLADQVIDVGIREDAWVSVSRTRVASVAGADKSQNTQELFRLDSDDKRRLAWAANANTYFTCTIAPQGADGADAPPYVTSLAAVDLDGDDDTSADVTTRIVTRERRLQPDETVRYPAALYIGEKDADAFKRIGEYAARNYYQQISQGFGYCTFTWLVELMIWLLETLHYVVRDYGIAIIALVIIVRTLLHPITKKGQVNMVRMQQKMGEFTPKLEELKKKYANDKARLQQETMKLYRDEGINPAGQIFTCLPMALQMPVWAALFLSLSNSIGMRHEGAFFLPWVNDLTAQDALIPFPTPLTIPLVGIQIESFNLLPFMAALFMYIQQKTQPKPEPKPNASPEQIQQQEMMQKMMPFMSIVMLVIFYKMPSGLNLYITFSMLFGWIEQKRIRAHIKEQKETGAFKKPAGPDKGRRSDKPSFFQKLQRMAEEAQQQQARRQPKKDKSKR